MPLTRCVTDIAKRYEVIQVISLGMALPPEVTKAPDVMHVQFLAILCLSFTAVLACELIALAGCYPCWLPGGAIVRLVAAAPVVMFLAAITTRVGLTSTLERAKAALRGCWFDRVFLAAFFAVGLVSRWFEVRDIGHNAFARTNLRAVHAGPVGKVREFLVAGRAIGRNHGGGPCLVVTGIRAVHTRLTLPVFKLVTARLTCSDGLLFGVGLPGHSVS